MYSLTFRLTLPENTSSFIPGLLGGENVIKTDGQTFTLTGEKARYFKKLIETAQLPFLEIAENPIGLYGIYPTEDGYTFCQIDPDNGELTELGILSGGPNFLRGLTYYNGRFYTLGFSTLEEGGDPVKLYQIRSDLSMREMSNTGIAGDNSACLEFFGDYFYFIPEFATPVSRINTNFERIDFDNPDFFIGSDIADFNGKLYILGPKGLVRLNINSGIAIGDKKGSIIVIAPELDQEHYFFIGESFNDMLYGVIVLADSSYRFAKITNMIPNDDGIVFADIISTTVEFYGLAAGVL